MYLPLTKQHLLLLSGFGKAKAEKYGDEILDMVERYCNQYGLETNIDAKSANPKRIRKEKSTTSKEDKIPSASISLQLYQQGKSVAEIAAERNLSAGTIESHLISFIKTGEVSVTDFVSENVLASLEEKLIAHPDKSLSELKAIVGDEVSFSAIRAVVQHLQKQEL